MKYRDNGISDHVLQFVRSRKSLQNADVVDAHLVRRMAARLGLGGSSGSSGSSSSTALGLGLRLLGRHLDWRRRISTVTVVSCVLKSRKKIASVFKVGDGRKPLNRREIWNGEKPGGSRVGGRSRSGARALVFIYGKRGVSPAPE